MSSITQPVRQFAVTAHSTIVQRLAAGADRGASHATEVAGAVVLVGVIWAAIQGLGLDGTLGDAITQGVEQAIGGGGGGQG